MPNDNQPAKSYIATVLARADGATKGPWKTGPEWDPKSPQTCIYPPEESEGSSRLCEMMTRWDGKESANAAFAAHARQDIPTLGKMLLRAIGALEDVANNRCEYESDGRMMRAAAKNVLAYINALAKGSQ